MAKSPTEQIRELTTDVRVLEAGNESLREQAAYLKATDQKRQDENVELRRELTELRRELADIRQDNAVLKQQLQDHIAQYQEWDRRRWGWIVLLLGAVLSLASGLIVTLARK